jgi:hypothetical protein
MIQIIFPANYLFSDKSKKVQTLDIFLKMTKGTVTIK